MGSYRATSVQHGRSASTAGNAPQDDEIEREAPPVSVGQNERRMQVRAYNLWTSLLGARNFPKIADLASANIPDFAENAVVLDFSGGDADPMVAMLGNRLAEECGAAQAIKRLSDVPGRSLLSRITDHYKQILTNQAPIGFEAEFINLRNKTVVYRGILLPFSDDGQSIQHIMGVMNWKELADATITAKLIDQLDIALSHGPAAGHPIMAQLGEWADGPAAAIPDGETGLLPEWNADWDYADSEAGDELTIAQEAAAAAHAIENLARDALHAVLGQVWDLALSTSGPPQLIGSIPTATGSRMAGCTPMTALIKQVFGANCDKTRLAELTMALTHAQRLGLARGELAGYLAQTPGGLKAVVRQERKLRRAGPAMPCVDV